MISDEVKKSFKKLTVRGSHIFLAINPHLPTQREEKAHDEKMSAANEKIKQAGEF